MEACLWSSSSGSSSVRVHVCVTVFVCESGAERSQSISTSSQDEWFMSPDWSRPFFLHPAPPLPCPSPLEMINDKAADRGGVEKERGHHQKWEFILIDALSRCIERLIDSRAFIHFPSRVAPNAPDEWAWLNDHSPEGLGRVCVSQCARVCAYIRACLWLLPAWFMTVTVYLYADAGESFVFTIGR